MPSHIPHQIIDGIEMKLCGCCKEYKPLSEYIKSNQHKDGLHVYCNNCRHKKKKAEYDRHRDSYVKRARDYYYDNHEAELEKRRKYAEMNKDFVNELRRLYRESHREEIAEINRQYRKNNKESLKAKESAKRQKPEYKILHNKRSRKYNVSDKGRLSKQLGRERYRNRQAAVSATLTKRQWEIIKRMFNHSCAYCGKELKNLTQDHFIPLSAGGGYDANNIIPCCKSCNSSKQNKDFFEWYPVQPFYDPRRKYEIVEYLALFK
ncbi:MAG: HNH endonuclease [Eubacteriales bacterium]|nr:HNH endonuclease [Eubacteriales bacterium]